MRTDNPGVYRHIPEEWALKCSEYAGYLPSQVLSEENRLLIITTSAWIVKKSLKVVNFKILVRRYSSNFIKHQIFQYIVETQHKKFYN